MFRIQGAGRLPAPVRIQPQSTALPVAPVQSSKPPHLPLLQQVQPQILQVTPAEAVRLIKQRLAPDALQVSGQLDLSGAAWLRELPRWLRCSALIVDNCPQLGLLPEDLQCDRLSAKRTPALTLLEGRISVRERADFSGSGLQKVNAELRANRLILSECRSLTELRGHISVNMLDVSNCSALRHLDENMHVVQTLELAGTALQALPKGLRAGLRWSGVPVDARFVLQPETLTGREVLLTRNVQRRRILLERLGIEQFLADVGGLVLDRDRDAGGERQLVQVPFDDDEPLVAVLVRCPSTGGRYVLRVPPFVRSCAEAVAWTANLSVTDYKPLREA